MSSRYQKKNTRQDGKFRSYNFGLDRSVVGVGSSVAAATAVNVVVWKTVYGGTPWFLTSLKAFEEFVEDFTKVGHARFYLCR